MAPVGCAVYATAIFQHADKNYFIVALFTCLIEWPPAALATGPVAMPVAPLQHQKVYAGEWFRLSAGGGGLRGLDGKEGQLMQTTSFHCGRNKRKGIKAKNTVLMCASRNTFFQADQKIRSLISLYNLRTSPFLFRGILNLWRFNFTAVIFRQKERGEGRQREGQ